MSKEISKEENQEITKENIFEDFISDEGLGEEIENINKEQQKDTYYYLSIFSSIFKFVNLILFLIIILFYSYNYIQKREKITDYNILSPICDIFLGESSKNIDGCYGVYAKLKEEQKTIDKLKNNQYEKIFDILGDVYSLENFLNSENIIFLLTKSKEKIDYINLLSEFNKLKNKFEPFDKDKVKCSNIFMNNEKILELECVIYSSNWDPKIRDLQEVGFKGKGGTSISIASIFVDFIDKDETFTLLDKQKTFSSSDVSGKGFYTKSTTVKLKLKYNKFNNLSL